ncbi:hypothetical protein [Mesoplasma lactucae]|uniref:Uncharacterized protein n=1 Tax=Mesoplasma lactucae ATCC 49193 TaxID=81460 RepID=A0A291IQS0_9MOLU|nr:hypothetical protein [Mesoplasma lactucae]ATG97285.1 hypothetical protein CP520_00735 [Mesoplasma lactucae ATCC 49193]ATZ20265.1 hypothetical protein MLACT_v1c04440 [Mesoplasma lactucae ATCC 49193]MCL8216436.1 hypothetical protein [Mesoplasma lactucae ATCC 49193]
MNSTNQENIKPKYKVWTNHYDLSEINHSNWKDLIKQEFKINTKTITFLAMMLTLNIIFEVISRFVLGLFPVGGFLTFNINFWIYIITFMGAGVFYTILMIEVGSWFRMALGNDAVSCLAINLSDLTMFLFFFVIIFLINFTRVKLMKIETNKQKQVGYLISLIIAYVLATLITSGMDVVYNKYFLIDLYYSSGGKPTDLKPILITVLWFNIVQYLISLVIFIPTYKVDYLLVNKYFGQSKL